MSRCTGMVRPQVGVTGREPASGSRYSGGRKYAVGEWTAQKSDDHSGTSIRRGSPASPLGGAWHRKDSTGAPATSLPAPPPGCRRRGPAPPADAQLAERAPIPGRGRAVHPAPLFLLHSAEGHGQSSRNGDVSSPTMAERRGDLRGHGDGPAGRATPVATSSATDRRNPCRNLVLLVDWSDRSRGASSSATARTGSSGPRTVRQHCCVLRHPPPQGRARCERAGDGGACGCTAAPPPPHLPRSR